MFSEKYYCGFLCTVWTLGFVVKVQADFDTELPETKEYCSAQSFHPRCGNDEVIVMHNASYGRMRLGKCVKEDMGYLGCGTHVLSVLDQTCSGRQECEVRIPNEEMNALLTCVTGELSRYLEASYTCEKAVQIAETLCKSRIDVPVTSGGSGIVSFSADDKACGSRSGPWLLETQPGQQLNISLIDFSWRVGRPMTTYCNQVYGEIEDLETKAVTRICGGKARVQHLLVSQGHLAQIFMHSHQLKASNFMIKFAAVGCPDLVAPRDAWIRREADTTIVGCHYAKQTWHLKCEHTKWIGVMGNCSHHIYTARQRQATEEGLKVSHGIVIFIICAVAIIMSCATIVIGIFCIKRHAEEEKQYHQAFKADYMKVHKYQNQVSTGAYQSYHDVRRSHDSARKDQHYSLHSNDSYNAVPSPQTDPAVPSGGDSNLKVQENTDLKKERSSHSIQEASMKFFVLDKNIAAHGSEFL